MVYKQLSRYQLFSVQQFYYKIQPKPILECTIKNMYYWLFCFPVNCLNPRIHGGFIRLEKFFSNFDLVLLKKHSQLWNLQLFKLAKTTHHIPWQTSRKSSSTNTQLVNLIQQCYFLRTFLEDNLYRVISCCSR